MSSIMLKELINRAVYGVLKNDIINILHDKSINNVNIDVTVHRNTNNEISLYVYFLRNKNEYAHISFHLTDIRLHNIKSSRDNISGPLHLVINSVPEDIYEPIKIVFNHNNKIKFTFKNNI